MESIAFWAVVLATLIMIRALFVEPKRDRFTQRLAWNESAPSHIIVGYPCSRYIHNILVDRERRVYWFHDRPTADTRDDYERFFLRALREEKLRDLFVPLNRLTPLGKDGYVVREIPKRYAKAISRAGYEYIGDNRCIKKNLSFEVVLGYKNPFRGAFLSIRYKRERALEIGRKKYRPPFNDPVFSFKYLLTFLRDFTEVMERSLKIKTIVNALYFEANVVRLMAYYELIRNNKPIRNEISKVSKMILPKGDPIWFAGVQLCDFSHGWLNRYTLELIALVGKVREAAKYQDIRIQCGGDTKDVVVSFMMDFPYDYIVSFDTTDEEIDHIVEGLLTWLRKRDTGWRRLTSLAA